MSTAKASAKEPTLDHDLFILQQRSISLLNESHTCELEALNGLIDERQRELGNRGVGTWKAVLCRKPVRVLQSAGWILADLAWQTAPPARSLYRLTAQGVGGLSNRSL